MVKWMVWAAAGYGAVLGIAEFFVLRALARFALARRFGATPPEQRPPLKTQDTPQTRLRLAAAVLLYFGFAMAAVYIFTDQLVPAALGMLAGLLGTVGVGVWRWVRKQKKG